MAFKKPASGPWNNPSLEITQRDLYQGPRKSETTIAGTAIRMFWYIENVATSFCTDNYITKEQILAREAQ